MFRRRTKNSTAYTGVGNASPMAPQPNNNAMAAALTIGENLKQTQPGVYGNHRSASLQKPRPPQNSSPSLLKRSSSIQSSIAATPAPRTQSQLSHRHSMGPSSTNNRPQGYHPQSNRLSSLSSVHTADSNEARLRDLKLHHTPQTAQPRMVKKYIPTPNGIQVVEVPEDTMKQQIARSNSIRSGMTIGRSPSMQRVSRSHSMTNAIKHKGNPQLRNSSLNTPRIEESAEFEEPAASRGYSELELQIQKEKQYAEQLEKQRAELERLKKLRAENEEKRLALEKLQAEEAQAALHTAAVTVPSLQDDTEEESVDIPIPSAILVDEVDQKKYEEARGESVSHPLANEAPVTPDFPPISTSPQEALESSYADHFVSIESLDKPPLTSEVSDFGIEEIPAESFDSPNLAQDLRPEFVKQESTGTQDLNGLSTDNYDSADETLDNSVTYTFLSEPPKNTEPASPKFIPVPEIIDGDIIPPSNFAGSIRSFSSSDSRSRPLKSAMKNSKPSVSSIGTSGENSPAHKAYLSLTTAENTRLNSKLSASHLSEAFTDLKTATSTSPSRQQTKRPQSYITKQSTGDSNQGGLSGKTLRPHSMVQSSQARNGGGMSSRTFKSQPSPFPSHPMAQANYKSPSKTKAAELYAKANKRPVSEFRTLERKSSFSRDAGTEDEPPRAQASKVGGHRTLRSPGVNGGEQVSAPSYGTAPQSQGRANYTGFKSKIIDSDSDDEVPAVSNSNGFRSRFDAPEPRSSARVNQNSSAPSSTAPLTTLREPPKDTSASGAEKKDKKPKKKFLKKLFGRN